MANDKIMMPSSTAGITRYFDESQSKISFKPEYIIVLVIIVLAVVILLRKFGSSWFGLG